MTYHAFLVATYEEKLGAVGPLTCPLWSWSSWYWNFRKPFL